MAEIVVATHTKRLMFNLEGLKNNKLFYWRDGGQGAEVDIVIIPFSAVLPIEVKYQETIGNSDIIGIKRFKTKFDSNFALIISKDELSIQASFIKIPAWVYLIMC
ncbi:MAG TPA: hypothetical protein VEL11_12960 [Candidatus Bathyarchaeia archaeon]|nr:hypothetical protein [Candidatus Bathyarchaeia archaeon]